jgi:hypothetical protein
MKKILGLFEVKTIDEAIQLIEDSHYQELRQNYESEIDSNFYS